MTLRFDHCCMPFGAMRFEGAHAAVAILWDLDCDSMRCGITTVFPPHEVTLVGLISLLSLSVYPLVCVCVYFPPYPSLRGHSLSFLWVLLAASTAGTSPLPSLHYLYINSPGQYFEGFVLVSHLYVFTIRPPLTWLFVCETSLVRLSRVAAVRGVLKDSLSTIGLLSEDLE